MPKRDGGRGMAEQRRVRMARLRRLCGRAAAAVVCGALFIHAPPLDAQTANTPAQTPSGQTFSGSAPAPNVRKPPDGIVSADPQAIKVEARAIEAFKPGDASQRRVGSLDFRGGLVLSSDHRNFGGISGMVVDGKGEHFIALSDHGDWFTGRMVYNGDAPAGWADVMTAPILGAEGGPIAQRGRFDTESLAADGTTLYVGVERDNVILRFDASKGVLASRGFVVDAPAALKKWPFNKGTEGLVFVPRHLPLGGALIAFSERALDENKNLQALIIGGPNPGLLSLKRLDEFDVSDAAILPNGDVLVLERRFKLTSGIAVRLRRIPLAAFKPGALVEGKIIFDADMGYEIDNLEALAVHRNAKGETILTMMSDDNFSVIQRTILLQFALVD